jgi:hypothetical protein
MHPDDARKLWCPFTRVALVEGMSANRTASMGRGGYADISEETRCLANDCMLWRWHGLVPPHGECGMARRED